MTTFSKRAYVISSILGLLGFTLIGMTIELTIIGMILFIPIFIVQTHNYRVENNLKYFKIEDEFKIIEAILKDKI